MYKFKNRVKKFMEQEGWHVEFIDGEPINLKCRRSNRTKFIRAIGNGHGHIYRKTFDELEEFQKRNGGYVLIAKVNGDNRIVLHRLSAMRKSVYPKEIGLTLTTPREFGFIAYENGRFKKTHE